MNRKARRRVAAVFGTQPESYREMAAVKNPYGDGRASERIGERIAGSDPVPWHNPSRE